MDQLETYNRVASLEPPTTKTILTSIYSLLLLIGLTAMVSAIIAHLPWHYALIIALACLLVIGATHHFQQQRAKSCRFCTGPLSHHHRPLLLTAEFLSMQGFKQDEYFYTLRRHPTPLSKKRPVKISNRCLTCHHCRLTEHQNRQYIQALNKNEIASLPVNNKFAC